jgi:hypothetical protein
LQNVAVVWAKNANIFATFFREDIFKIITSTPGRDRRGSRWRRSPFRNRNRPPEESTAPSSRGSTTGRRQATGLIPWACPAAAARQSCTAELAPPPRRSRTTRTCSRVCTSGRRRRSSRNPAKEVRCRFF